MAKRRALRKGERVNTRKKSPKPKTTKVEKPEGMTIRWMERDKAKIAKAVKRVNAKATRLNDKGFDIPKISAREIKKNFLTRKDFNKFLKEVDKFVERGSEKGKKREDIWGFEKSYHMARHKRREAIKAKQLKDFMEEDIFSRGQKVGKRKDQTNKSRFMSDHEHSLKPTKFNTSTRSGFNKMVKSMDRFFNPKFEKAKNETYKNNMIVAVKNELNDEELAKMFAMLPADKLVELARNDSEFNLDYVYHKIDQQYRINTLKTIVNEEIDKVRANSIRDLKRKGTPEDVLEKINELSNEEYAVNFVEDFDLIDRADPLGIKHTFAKYNISDDINGIKRKFGIR